MIYDLLRFQALDHGIVDEQFDGGVIVSEARKKSLQLLPDVGVFFGLGVDPKFPHVLDRLFF